MSYPHPTPRPVVLQVLPALKDGGVESSAIEMALYLKSHNYPNYVASAGGPKTAILASSGIPHIRLSLNSKNPLVILWNALCLTKVIHRHGVTLVHARSRAPAWSSWLAARFAGVAYVTTFHGTYGLKGGALKRIYNSVMLKGPIIIANSEFIRTHIMENYGVNPNRIVVAPRGIEPSVFNPENYSPKDVKTLKTELHVGEEPLILIVGRITRWKGHDLLLEALAGVQNLPWTLLVAGAGDKDSAYAEALKKRAQVLGLASRIRWLGSRRDVPRLLAASSLAVSTSTKPEAFGRVAIEAMAMGVPVVATGIGGSTETIRDGVTGYLVKPSPEGTFGEFRPQDVTLKLRGALQNPKALHSMGKAARAHVLATYTVDKCCEAEAHAYARVLASRAVPQKV